jgi:drug/metabolite transporter (DMT)-like permease
LDTHVVQGLAIGLVASVALAAGLAIMKSRGETLPPAEGTGIPRAILRWFSDPVWLAGLLCETLGYMLYFAALAYAPVSLVAVMMQGGIAAFVLMAIAFLHERASRSEAAGIAGIVLAMVLIALSSPADTPERALKSDALGALSSLFALTAAMPWLITRLRRNGTAPAIASGVAFGLGSLYTKALADIFTASSGYAIALHIVASPWFYLMIGSNVGGLVLLQNSFHWARGIIAMPLSSAVSNLVPIIGGILAFGESLPSDTIAAMLRIAAFLLTVMSGLLLANGA